MIPVLIAVFVLSGAAGLIYESIWSRYLGLFVGHSAYAQIIVLVIFLGGMSLGAHLAGRRSHRVRSPLLWYAAVEIVVGILALAFHDTFTAVTAAAYDSIFPGLAGGGVTLTVVKWAIASALILPQSILLGTTFPLMSAGVIRIADAGSAPGRILALLYFANSLGAAAGVLLAGFVLIEAVGLPGAILVAAFMNIVAALVVGVLARAHERLRAARTVAEAEALPAGDAAAISPSGGMESPPGAAVPAVETAPPDPPAAAAPVVAGARNPLWRPLLAVAFGTAVASFIYEIAWIRMLSLVLGSATHSFELMLSAFILGLALGAFWVRTRADHFEDPVRVLGYVQWAMGLLAVATLPLYLASFEWMAALIQTVQANENGYRAFLLTRYALALLVMLPATFCAGMTLPLITRVLMRSGAGEPAIGAVYAINTLGSIGGVILAGLVLMPALGLKLLLLFGAVIDIGLGVWLVARTRRTVEPAAVSARLLARLHARSLALPVAVTGAVLIVIALASRFDLGRLTSGVYRHGVLAGPGEYSFLYYKDGRTATVSMRRSSDGFITLATNGKPDASMDTPWMDTLGVVPGQRMLTRDIATQLLLPLITLAHAPDAQHMAVIGHGSGMSSHVLLGSSRAREVVTIEIEPEMIEASRHFRPANRRVFDDERSKFVIDDAKAYFASSGRTFDLILSEPSNPWVSGVSGLFTVEFYDRVRRQLAPHGVFGQWLHLYELSDGLVTSVLAAIDSIFPAYEVYFTSNSDILVVAANDTLTPPDWNVTEYPGIAEDLARAVPLTPELFGALRLGGRNELRPLLLVRGSPNSDFFPVLDLGAERMRFMRESADGYIGLSEGRFDVMAALAGRRAGFGTAGTPATPEIPRPVALALGARIRAARTLPPAVAAQLPRDPDMRVALYRVDQLERLAQSNAPPADWHTWMTSVVTADEDLHGGTAGVADTVFFDRLRRYAARTGAPAEARSALDFLEAIGTWNWPVAAVSAKALMASADTLDWIPDALLRNGAAVAFIKIRDHEGAKEVLRHFARRTTEDAFRDRLIGAYLVYADTTLRGRMGWR
jgi:spermidine synthase